jgi:hypothetical protein
MLNIDPVKEWETQAIYLDQEKADQDVYEFDLSQWMCLKRLSQINPQEAACQFQLSLQTAERMAQVTLENLKRLASGTIMSFILDIDEHSILQKLAQTHDLMIDFPQKEGDISTHYWLLLKRLAHRDVMMAKVSFGVSRQLAQAIALATDHQLRNLAQGQEAVLFSLRFPEWIIQDTLENENMTYAVFKKILLSLGRLKKRSRPPLSEA